MYGVQQVTKVSSYSQMSPSLISCEVVPVNLKAFGSPPAVLVLLMLIGSISYCAFQWKYFKTETDKSTQSSLSGHGLLSN